MIQTASLPQIKKELQHLSPEENLELLLRLARSKKENKELLSYLLFDAHDQGAFIEGVKTEMDLGMAALNSTSFYLAKKTVRKVLRLANKYIRYAKDKQVEAELLIHFCKLLKLYLPELKYSRVLLGLYDRQLAKAKKAVSGLHEDLRIDYQFEFDDL